MSCLRRARSSPLLILEDTETLSPKGIEKALELREGKFQYQDLAAFGHIGRTDMDIPWERLNKVEELKKAIEL